MKGQATADNAINACLEEIIIVYGMGIVVATQIINIL
jgi:hypothetical protein